MSTETMTAPPPPRPTIGRIVHVRLSGRCHAALVTGPPNHRAGIGVRVWLQGGGHEDRTDVAQEAAHRKDGTWHWPDRA